LIWFLVGGLFALLNCCWSLFRGFFLFWESSSGCWWWLLLQKKGRALLCCCWFSFFHFLIKSLGGLWSSIIVHWFVCFCCLLVQKKEAATEPKKTEQSELKKKKTESKLALYSRLEKYGSISSFSLSLTNTTLYWRKPHSPPLYFLPSLSTFPVRLIHGDKISLPQTPVTVKSILSNKLLLHYTPHN